MKAQHTAGPWKVVAEPNGIEYSIMSRTKSSKFYVAMFYGDAGTGDTKANAQLCASAPAMLEALKALFEHCAMIHKRGGENSNQKEGNAAIEAGKAAIAQAEGN